MVEDFDLNKEVDDLVSYVERFGDGCTVIDRSIFYTDRKTRPELGQMIVEELYKRFMRGEIAEEVAIRALRDICFHGHGEVPPNIVTLTFFVTDKITKPEDWLRNLQKFVSEDSLKLMAKRMGVRYDLFELNQRIEVLEGDIESHGREIKRLMEMKRRDPFVEISYGIGRENREIETKKRELEKLKAKKAILEKEGTTIVKLEDLFVLTLNKRAVIISVDAIYNTPNGTDCYDILSDWISLADYVKRGTESIQLALNKAMKAGVVLDENRLAQLKEQFKMLVPLFSEVLIARNSYRDYFDVTKTPTREPSDLYEREAKLEHTKGKLLSKIKEVVVLIDSFNQVQNPIAAAREKDVDILRREGGGKIKPKGPVERKPEPLKLKLGG